MGMMSADAYTTSRRLAEKTWERKGGGVGRRNAQWQRMGAILWRMKERGLVTYRTTDHGQKEWRRRMQTPNAELRRGGPDNNKQPGDPPSPGVTG